MVVVIFFRGATIATHGLKGVIPTLIRVCTKPKGWHLSIVPAHVAIAFSRDFDKETKTYTYNEYESIVTGIKSGKIISRNFPTLGLFRELSGIVAIKDFLPTIESEKEAEEWLKSLVGERYGFETVALTAVGNLPGDPPRLFRKLWELMKSGRSYPKSCSALVQETMFRLGLPMTPREDGFPMSPVDVLIAMQGK